MKTDEKRLEMGGIRPDKMTSRERFVAMFKGKAVERISFVPFILGFAAKNTGISMASFYGDPDKSFRAQKMTEQQYGIDGGPATGYADYGAWEFGGEARLPVSRSEQSIMVTRRPVNREEEGMNQKLPDVRTAGYLPTMLAFGRRQVKEGGSASCFGMTPFSIAVSLAGVERFCQWMITNPDLCHHLLRLATEHRMQVVDYWVGTFGMERVKIDHSTGPETNAIISPEQFEEFVLPYTQEVHERILAMGFRSIYMHICGDHTLNLPYWEQIPMGNPGMMTFGHQMDLGLAVERFGDENIIFGNVEPSLILEGPPEKIYEACREAILKGKKGKRGFSLMSGCELSPDTPPYHLWVMRKAVNDFGWYD